ncbi:MAG: PEP-CTERM sorting domain-containing protein [candidate division Zixibacteria bacterium]|nr:PEP-CTERM sorting domain-containing protein [candidate division Zixibacteria bacterium]
MMKSKFVVIAMVFILLFAIQSFAAPTFFVNGTNLMDVPNAYKSNSILNFTGGTQNWTLIKEFAGWNRVNNFGYYDNFTAPSPSIVFPGSSSAVSYATTNIAAGTDVGLYSRSDLGRSGGDPNLYSHTQYTSGTADNSYQFFYVFDVKQYQGTNAAFTINKGSFSYTTSGNYDYLVYVDDSGAGPDYDHNDMILGVSAVPEPGTFMLLSIGLAGMGWYRRKS